MTYMIYEIYIYIYIHIIICIHIYIYIYTTHVLTIYSGRCRAAKKVEKQLRRSLVDALGSGMESLKSPGLGGVCLPTYVHIHIQQHMHTYIYIYIYIYIYAYIAYNLPPLIKQNNPYK